MLKSGASLPSSPYSGWIRQAGGVHTPQVEDVDLSYRVQNGHVCFYPLSRALDWRHTLPLTDQANQGGPRRSLFPSAASLLHRYSDCV